MLRKKTLIWILILFGAGSAFSTARALDVETFAGIPAGTVIGGQLPQGGMTDGSKYLENIDRITVWNNNGPHSAIIFDSSNPSSDDDWDLGTPNETCGGPGIGAGGEVGQPGENCVAYGNLVIIAENLGDVDDDDVVDFPDDDADGGGIMFEFVHGIRAASVVLVDIDSETASAELSNGVLTITVKATDLGDNSIQTLDLGGIGLFDTLKVVFSGSGALAEMTFQTLPLSVENESWGGVKAKYRDR